MLASCMVNHVRSVIAILQCDVALSTRSSYPIDNIASGAISVQHGQFKILNSACSTLKLAF